MTLMTHATASRQQRNERQRGRVLLVMNERMARLCGPTLEEAGACVVGVTGGMAAIVSVQRTRPNIVVAEIELNDLRAAELVRTIANLHENMPLIFVSSSARKKLPSTGDWKRFRSALSTTFSYRWNCRCSRRERRNWSRFN